MTDEQIFRLALLVLLFILSAFFSGSETALMAIDRLRVKYLVEKKRRGAKRLEALLDKPDRLLGAILVGNNLVNVAASVIATGLFVQIFGEQGELLTILALTPLILIFAEVLPKTYAAQSCERVAFWVMPPIRVVMWFLAPVTWVLSGFSRMMIYFLRGEEDRPVISEDEIRTMISVGEEAGAVAKDTRRMLHGVLELSEIRARDVMIPRTEVTGIEVQMPFDEILRLVQQARHSRFPVFNESLDNVIGVIHSKDILNYVHRPDEFRVASVCREPFFVPESQRIETLLQSFRRKREHLAIVVDEYGGVEGIATLEDVVEEIVGEIRDEYDLEEVLVRKLEPGRYLIDGSAALKSLSRRFDLDLSEEYANTLAGLMLRTMGTIPREGDSCKVHGVVLIARQVVDRRVEEIEMVIDEGEHDPDS